MLIKRLRKVGNSQALFLDKPILDMLDITMDTEFQVLTEGNEIRLVPLTAAQRKAVVGSAIKRTFKNHGPLMKNLAK